MTTDDTSWQRDLALAEKVEKFGMAQAAAPKPARTLKEQRIMAGFEEIARFREVHGHAPRLGEGADIFERLYAVRLDCLRADPQAVTLLAEGHDHWGLLTSPAAEPEQDMAASGMDDEALAALLGEGSQTDMADSITTLKHVSYRKELNTAEDIATQIPCKDFDLFKPLFQKVAAGLKTGSVKSWGAKDYNTIRRGDFFILKGMIVYVAAILKARQGYDSKSERLRVIYANGTESDLLSSSLARALYKDRESRKISALDVAPLHDTAPLFAAAAGDGNGSRADDAATDSETE